LEIIIEVAKNLQPIEKLKIVLLGDGPIKSDLIAQSQKAGLKNLFFLHPVPKAGMYGVLNEINMAWVPLKKLPLFEGAIPSKIFENLSMEKPILLGVSGESKMHFIENAQAGVFYEPENAADMCTKLTDILEGKYPLEVMGKNGRTYVEKHFNRDSIAHDFLATLQQHNI
jgi:glycosyltransferase involved in cell wall biosynthesis